MSTRKSVTPVAEEMTMEQEPEEKDVNEKLMAEIEALRKENDRLRMSSVASPGAGGGGSDWERVQAACRKAAEEGADSWKIKISVRAPRRPAKEDPFYWLSINGRTMQVPANDRYFELPLPFAACLTDMIQAEWAAADYADSIEDYDPVTNPKRDN